MASEISVLSNSRNENPVVVECPCIWFGDGPDPTRVPVLDVMINEDYATSGLISTGTTHDIINEAFVDKIGAKKIPVTYPCVFGHQNLSPIKSKVQLKFQANGITFIRECYVVSTLAIDLVFGYSFTRDFGDLISFGDLSFNGQPMYNP